MQSAEPKPAFQAIQFPEPFKRASSEARGPNGHAPDAEIRLLTPQEVASRLGVSERWVRDHATRRQPRIPCVRLGGRQRAVLRFRPQGIQQFVTQNREPGEFQ